MANAWIKTAAILTEHSIPVLVLAPGLKRPVPRPQDKSWWVWDSPDGCDIVYEAARRITGGAPNLAMLLGWEKNSYIGAVDLDVHHNPRAVDQARELGVNSKDSVWVSRTGRGGFHVYYQLPHGFDCKRSTAAAAGDGSAIDLLVNGYAVIAPSDTSRESQGGGPYQWVAGHSPFEIAPLDLRYPPDALLDWWRQRVASIGSTTPRSDGVPTGGAHALDVDRVLAGVGEGERNETLFRYASSLRARGVRRSEAEALVRQVAGRCTPPMPEHEALACLESAWKYPDKPAQAPMASWAGVQSDDSALI